MVEKNVDVPLSIALATILNGSMEINTYQCGNTYIKIITIDERKRERERKQEIKIK